MAKKMNWRADLQKIRNNREKADNAAKRAEEKAKKLAQRQEEAENMGILYVVRSMRLTRRSWKIFWRASRRRTKRNMKNRRNSGTMNLLKNKMGMRVFDAGALRGAGRIGAGGQGGKRIRWNNLIMPCKRYDYSFPSLIRHMPPL